MATGLAAYSFAAPGWQCTLSSRTVLAARNFLYASDTRGAVPFFPAFGDTVTKVLEIPTTLPTLDELLGFHGCRPQDFTSLVLSRLEGGLPQVLTIHAEMEGGPFLGEFARLLTRCSSRRRACKPLPSSRRRPAVIRSSLLGLRMSRVTRHPHQID